MELDFLSVVIPLVTSTVSGIIAYASAKSQNKTEIEKLNVVHKSEIEKVLIQQKFEMNQFKQQQELEIARIKEQHIQEIEKLSVEIDKQAELYEKNAQTDMIKDFMGSVMKGDMNGFNNLMNIVSQIDKYYKK